MGYKLVLASAPLKGQLPAQSLKVKLFTCIMLLHLESEQLHSRQGFRSLAGTLADFQPRQALSWSTFSYAIALVQETHWSTSGEWTRGDWTFIHSASQRPRQDGVMVAIRTSLLTSDEVLRQEIHPGRLLRVRAVLDQPQWVIFSLYQHAMSAGSASDKDKLLDKKRNLEKVRQGHSWRAL